MAENLSLAKQYEQYIGKTVGNYSLERLIERLETGPVFFARHIQGKAPYRLRLLALPAGLSSEERLVYLGHFQREASQIATLQHAGILPLSDYGIYQGAPYLVSPDLPLKMLQTFLAPGRPMEALLVSRYLDEIAASLEYAHQQGILHLNLHVCNVGVQMNGQLVVAEYGLTRILAPKTPGATSELQPGLENGSALLRDRQGRLVYGLSLASAPAPELLLGRPVDTSADVYALGALCYQLLTSHRAFRAETLPEVARQHLEAAIPQLNIWRQGLPAELDYLLSSALAKNPAQRFRSPGAFADAYAQIVAPGENGRKSFGVTTAPPSPSARNQEPSPPRQMQPLPGALPSHTATNSQAALSRRRTLQLLAAGGGVAAAAGVAVWFIERSPSGARSGAGSSAPVTTAGSGGQHGTILAHVSDVPPNSAKSFPLPNSDNPGLLIHLPDKQFVAFNSTCTHAGCAVHYNAQDHLLECPCHNASFDPAKNAAVVGGPAPAPLTPIHITVNADGTIVANG